MYVYINMGCLILYCTCTLVAVGVIYCKLTIERLWLVPFELLIIVPFADPL